MVMLSLGIYLEMVFIQGVLPLIIWSLLTEITICSELAILSCKHVLLLWRYMLM